MGEYAYYRVLDQNFDLDKIYKLQIDLHTFLGDADLYVSTSPDLKFPNTTAFEFKSAFKDFYDRVTIIDTVNDKIAPQLYIGVHANTYSEFELAVRYEYHPVYN